MDAMPDSMPEWMSGRDATLPVGLQLRTRYGTTCWTAGSDAIHHCLPDFMSGRDAALHARGQEWMRCRTSGTLCGPASRTAVRDAMQQCLPLCRLKLARPLAPGLTLPNQIIWTEIILTLKIHNEIKSLHQTILMITLVSSIDSGTFIYYNL